MEEFARRLRGINLFTTSTMFGATFLLPTLPLIASAGSIGLARLVQTSYEQILGQSHPRRGNLDRFSSGGRCISC